MGALESDADNGETQPAELQMQKHLPQRHQQDLDSATQRLQDCRLQLVEAEGHLTQLTALHAIEDVDSVVASDWAPSNARQQTPPFVSKLCYACSGALDVWQIEDFARDKWIEVEHEPEYESCITWVYNEDRLVEQMGRWQRAGCELCSYLAKRLKQDTRAKLHSYEWRAVRQRGGMIFQYRYYAWYGEQGRDGSVEFIFDIRIEGGDASQRSVFGIQKELDTDMVSRANLDLARNWLHDCDRSHSKCRSANENIHFPARLLALGKNTTDCPRLCDIGGMRDVKYAALSYCWGEGQHYKATTLNLSALHERIELASLPRTIVDAIQVTRSLGIEYIWVDSLCIIQDSAVDKKRELGRMAEIYRNAYVTIIAASAWRAMDGFLTLRPLPHILIRSPLEISESRMGAVILRSASQYRRDDARPDPTETRAWCLQESILSTRCLSFSSRHLQWCCQEVALARRDLSFAKPWHVPSTEKSHLVQNLPEVFRSGRRGSYLTTDDHEQLYQFWISVARQYSGRLVTNADDKFRAISALAQEYSRITHDTYCAGMWRYWMLRSLQWAKSNDVGVSSQETSMPTSHRCDAPTWSWLSTSRNVVFFDNANIVDPLQDTRDRRLEILDVAVQLRDPSEPTGPVTSGSLRVRGRMIPVLCWQLQSPNAHGDHSIRKPQSVVGPPTALTAGEELTETTDGGRGWFEWTTATLDHDIDIDGVPWRECSWGNEIQVWALEVVTHYNLVRGHDTEVGSGLILRKTQDGQHYRRVGYYSRRGLADGPWFEGVESAEYTIV